MQCEIVEMPPPSPRGNNPSGSVAVRPSNQPGNSGALILSDALEIEIRDARTGEPLNTGGYVKRCRITSASHDVDYVCPDADRHPPAKRRVDTYKGYKAQGDYQKSNFYRYVSASLKRLGRWDGGVMNYYSGGLGEAMCAFYGEWLNLDYSPDINEVIEDLEIYLQEALAGQDHVDASGKIHIGLPYLEEEETVTVTIEFHDIKFLLEDDTKAAQEAVLQSSVPPAMEPVAPKQINNCEIVYDRQSAAWPNGGADPDDPANESSMEFSNWALQVPITDATQSRLELFYFRNFAEVNMQVKPGEPRQWKIVLYALTWCQPVWAPETMFRRDGRERSNGNFGPTRQATFSAINTTHSGSSENYGVFGIFRINGGYHRLHTGVDVAGRSRDENGYLRTPVFAVHSGRAKRYTSNNILLHHGDEAVTRYVHMWAADLIAMTDQIVKAGSLLGKMGRNGVTGSKKIYPTHVHFETLLYVNTGWAYGNYTALAATDAAGKKMIDDSGYPVNPDMHESTKNPKYIKFQYGYWVRDPGDKLEEWIDAQLGGGSFESYYQFYMPASWPAYETPPCKNEFGSGYTAHVGRCEAKCRQSGTTAPESTQTYYAKTCWAVRTHVDPRKCSCPGLNARGEYSSFTDDQIIQYRLWQLGHYDDKPFDGSFGGGSRAALDEALETINTRCRDRLSRDSVFVAMVGTQTLEIRQAEAAKKKKDLADVPETARHRTQAIRELLNDDYSKHSLMSELESITP